MNKKKIYKTMVSCMLLLCGMLVLSCLMLCLLSMLVWRMDGGVRLVGGGIIAIYIITAFVGGFVMGKIFGKQKFFWGFLIGVLYFAVLLLVGILCLGTGLQGNERIFPGFMICSIAGMFGGMLSPGGYTNTNA